MYGSILVLVRFAQVTHAGGRTSGSIRAWVGESLEGDTSFVIKVLIVGKQLVVEEALQRALATEAGIRVTGIGRDLAETERLLAEVRPDVILARCGAAGDSGSGLVEEIVNRNPDVRVVVLTHHVDDEILHDFVTAGASGMVDLQMDGFAALVSALQRVAAGEFLLPTDTLRRIIRRQRIEFSRQRQRSDVIQRLTERELEILALLGAGLDNRSIAERLFVSVTTVRSHVQHLLAKLDLHSRLEAAVLANQYELAVGMAQASSGRRVRVAQLRRVRDSA
jgi:DNA-binding NarL/FixJ family response regulator